MDRRRDFLSYSMAAGFSLAAPRLTWGLADDHPYMKRMGLQLWTVRDPMSADPRATFQAIADAGYQQVESSLGNLERDTTLAAEHGLAVTSFFNDWQTLADPEAKHARSAEETIEAATRHNMQHLVFGYIGAPYRQTLDQYKAIAERTNRMGEACRAANVRLCYHNHSFEFQPLEKGVCGFDILMREFDPRFVEFELDVFWVKMGGWDPLKTMRQLGNRISQLHLKDLKAGSNVIYDEGQVPPDSFQELGNGTIDMGAVIALALELGVAQCHVEQDHSPDPLDSIVTSMQHLRSL